MAHCDPVGDSNRIKPARHTATLFNTFSGNIRLRIKCRIARRAVVACGHDAHKWACNFLCGQTHGIIITAVWGAFWSYRDVAAGQFRFVKLMRHIELLIQARLYGFCRPKPSFSET